jgi:hypothetical protein
MAKKIGIGLVIGFLTVSTIRYWMNVIYPRMQEYGLRRTASVTQTATHLAPDTPTNSSTKSSANTPQVVPLEQLLKEQTAKEETTP